MNGILGIVKTVARWCNLLKTYPSYQTCHRRFQKWVHAGVFEKITKSLVQDLEKRRKINLTEIYIDATYVDAQKGDLELEKRNVAMGQRLWQLQTISLFLFPLACRVLHNMRVSLLIKQLGPALQARLFERVVGDKAYNSDPLDRDIRERFGIEIIALYRLNRKCKATQNGRSLRRYKRRWRVELFFA